MECITYQKQTIAIIEHAVNHTKTSSFLTENAETIQLGLLAKKKNEKIAGHTHRKPKIQKHTLAEILLVLKGRVKVTFLTIDGKVIAEKILKKNDLLIQKSQGHAFEILADTCLLEIKPGPYTAGHIYLPCKK